MTKPIIIPEWDITEVNSIEPDSTHKQQGWIAPGGVPEKPAYQTHNHWQNNVYKWVNELNIKGMLEYDALTDYVATFSYVVGSDGIMYHCLIANGPSSSVVSPIGNPLTWERLSEPNKLVNVERFVTGSVLTGRSLLSVPSFFGS